MAKKRTTKKSSRKKSTKKTNQKSAVSSRKQSTNPLETMSLQEIQNQLKARERTIRNLKRRRDRLMEQLAEIDEQIYTLGGTPKSGGKRPRNQTNLGDALVAVLKGKPMSVTEAAQAVQEAGYRTTAESFRTIVNQRLITDNRIKKVSRGVYTAK